MNLGIGLMLGSRAVAAPPPVVASVNYTQFDVLGGGADIVLTGTGLMGAAVRVGSTDMTVTGNTPTSVSFAAPALGANIYTTTITTPGGTISGPLLEAWAPTTDGGVQGFDEEPSYASSAGNGTWTPRVGPTPSHATLAPPAVAGAPVFNGSTTRLDMGAINALIKTTSVQVGTVALVVKPTSAAAPSPVTAPFADAGLWSDAGRGAIGARYTQNGFGPFYTDGVSYKVVDVAMATGAAHVGTMRFLQNDALQVSVDGSAFAANSLALANNTTGNSTEVVQLGTNYSGLVHFAGTILAVIFHNTKVPDAYATKIYKWAQQRHGVA